MTKSLINSMALLMPQNSTPSSGEDGERPTSAVIESLSLILLFVVLLKFTMTYDAISWPSKIKLLELSQLINVTAQFQRLKNVNAKLVNTLDVLTKKLKVNYKKHTETATKLYTESKLALKDQVEKLQHGKSELKNQTEAFKILSEDSAKKGTEIRSQQKALEQLKEKMTKSEKYADDLQTQLNDLKRHKSKIDSGEKSSENEEEIKDLQKEVHALKERLSLLKDLLLNLHVDIDQQDEYLKELEEEKNYFQNLLQDLKNVSDLMEHKFKEMYNSLDKQSKLLVTMQEQQRKMKQIVNDNRIIDEPAVTDNIKPAKIVLFTEETKTSLRSVLSSSN